VLRVVEHAGRRAVLHDLPAAQHDRGVGELADHGEIVADQDEGHAGLVADVGEQVQHLRLDGHVQRGDGLIQDQDPWLGRQRAGDRHPLPLPAGQRSRHRPGPALIQADQAGELGDPGTRAQVRG